MTRLTQSSAITQSFMDQSSFDAIRNNAQTVNPGAAANPESLDKTLLEGLTAEALTGQEPTAPEGEAGEKPTGNAALSAGYSAEASV